MPTRSDPRWKASHRVRLTALGRQGGDISKGEALLTNLSSGGLCLTQVSWDGGPGRADDDGNIAVHIPLPDWVGVDVKIRPVRLRFGDDSMEIGAVIVHKPARFDEVLEVLGHAEAVEAR